MATEQKVTKILSEAGYDPKEGRAIIVTYAPVNLSEQIARFFTNEFFVLQICGNSLVLVPFGKLFMNLKKEVTLEIPFAQIRKVEVRENFLNYCIEIDTDQGMISLSAQQKELSEFRSSGALAAGMNGQGKDIKFVNWHRENLDVTLEELKSLGR